jgi:hypothetical protein
MPQKAGSIFGVQFLKKIERFPTYTDCVLGARAFQNELLASLVE